MGEPVEHLIKEYQEMQENEAEKLELATMAIFITGKDDPLHPPKDIMTDTEGGPERVAFGWNSCCHVLWAHLHTQTKKSEKAEILL